MLSSSLIPVISVSSHQVDEVLFHHDGMLFMYTLLLHNNRIVVPVCLSPQRFSKCLTPDPCSLPPEYLASCGGQVDDALDSGVPLVLCLPHYFLILHCITHVENVEIIHKCVCRQHRRLHSGPAQAPRDIQLYRISLPMPDSYRDYCSP